MGDKSDLTDIWYFCKCQSQSCDSDRQSSRPNMQPNLPKKAISKQHQQKQTELAGSAGTDKRAVTCNRDPTICIHICRSDDSVKCGLLTEPYVPSENYNIKADAPGMKRAFQCSWLFWYSPWLACSPQLKGPLFNFCVTASVSSSWVARQLHNWCLYKITPIQWMCKKS